MSWLEMWNRLRRGRNKGQVLDRRFGTMSEWPGDVPCLSAGEVDQEFLCHLLGLQGNTTHFGLFLTCPPPWTSVHIKVCFCNSGPWHMEVIQGSPSTWKLAALHFPPTHYTLSTQKLCLMPHLIFFSAMSSYLGFRRLGRQGGSTLNHGCVCARGE